MNPDGGTPAGSTPRVLAPVALVVIAVAVVAVVASSGGGSEPDQDGRERQEGARTGCTPSDDGEAARRNGYYVIQSGEPGLSAVADETCIPVAKLQRLNPDLDSQLIPQGGCVDLRRDGCKALAEG